MMWSGDSVSHYTERPFRLSKYFISMTTEATSTKARAEGPAAPEDAADSGCVGLLRPLRADARRNRAKVLEAAEEVFASEGLAVPIDEVARRAGVGVGTVYRHFPTKEALFEAIVVARLDALVERAEELSTADDPGRALFTFISELVDMAVKKKDLTDELARAGVNSEDLLAGVKERLEQAFDMLLGRAQQSGAVRPDINRIDMTALIMGTCMAASQHGCSEATQRLVGVLCDGFRAGR